jgi:hypothetical protein
MDRKRRRPSWAVGEDFLYSVSKAARNGPHAPPIGRLVAAAAAARRRPGRRPSASADSEKPIGAAETTGNAGEQLIRAGRRPAGGEVGTRRRSHAAPYRDARSAAGCLGRGRSGPGMLEGPYAGGAG